MRLADMGLPEDASRGLAALLPLLRILPPATPPSSFLEPKGAVAGAAAAAGACSAPKTTTDAASDRTAAKAQTTRIALSGAERGFGEIQWVKID